MGKKEKTKIVEIQEINFSSLKISKFCWMTEIKITTLSDVVPNAYRENIYNN